ncbi:MAG: HAMP domain-containing protein [Acidobacteria bacterium]|nr:HAMP domain-containing protein [Acidobacteriota bacterium]
MKTMLPVAATLIGGLVLLWITRSLQDPGHHVVMLVTTSGAVIIATVVLLVLAHWVQQPLLELQQKIARLHEGDFAVLASFAGRNDEIGDLGRDFNEMVRQLRESREAIEEAHRTQMSRAEHLATLGELAAGLAHEIRNPLAGIAGVIEIIGRDLPESSPSREVWKDVQQEIRQIQKILNELLDYARPKPPRFTLADLNLTAEHAASLARQQVLSRPIRITVVPAPPLPPVEHDAGQMQQVLLNLLLNAIQSIEGAGSIELSLNSEDDFAIVRVSDTGRGIDSKHLASIFRPFFTTKGQGTGLGLSLAQRIVEAHGGRIDATSAPGQGSQFTIRLPLPKAAEKSARSG